MSLRERISPEAFPQAFLSGLFLKKLLIPYPPRGPEYIAVPGKAAEPSTKHGPVDKHEMIGNSAHRAEPAVCFLHPGADQHQAVKGQLKAKKEKIEPSASLGYPASQGYQI